MKGTFLALLPTALLSVEMGVSVEKARTSTTKAQKRRVSKNIRNLYNQIRQYMGK